MWNPTSLELDNRKIYVYYYIKLFYYYFYLETNIYITLLYCTVVFSFFGFFKKIHKNKYESVCSKLDFGYAHFFKFNYLISLVSIILQKLNNCL